MRTRTITLAVTTTLVVLLLTVGGVGANGNDGSATGHAATPANGSAAEWMEQHMDEQIGSDAAAQMQDRMGMNYGEMGEHMASHQNGSMMDGRMMGGMMRGGMSGMGCH